MQMHNHPSPSSQGETKYDAGQPVSIACEPGRKRMHTRTRRQREALYAGIAGLPLPGGDQMIDRFNHDYVRKPHAATMHLLYDMHRILTRPARRALPGILTVA